MKNLNISKPFLMFYSLRSVINFELLLRGSFQKENNTGSGILFQKENFYLFMLGFYYFSFAIQNVDDIKVFV